MQNIISWLIIVLTKQIALDSSKLFWKIKNLKRKERFFPFWWGGKHRIWSICIAFPLHTGLQLWRLVFLLVCCSSSSLFAVLLPLLLLLQHRFKHTRTIQWPQKCPSCYFKLVFKLKTFINLCDFCKKSYKSNPVITQRYIFKTYFFILQPAN